MKHDLGPQRAPSPLPTYPEELESAQRQALRTTCFLAAALIVAFSALDRAVTPGLVLVGGREDALELGTRASFLLCTSVIGVAGAAIQDRLRRREHQARAEFARHVGLVHLGTLAGGLAHELANPLTSVSLELDAIDALLKPGEHTRHLRNAQQGLSRMRSILEVMRRLKHQVELVRDYGEVPPVRCQPTLLGQALVNLVVNAADALRDRPGARLCVRTRRLDGHALIEVQDNGPGVPADLRERIFEPFFSTKGAGGNGLGLWISAEIARLHGGELTLTEAPAGGSIFRLSLPLTPPPPD